MGVVVCGGVVWCSCLTFAMSVGALRATGVCGAGVWSIWQVCGVVGVSQPHNRHKERLRMRHFEG